MGRLAGMTPVTESDGRSAPVESPLEKDRRTWTRTDGLLGSGQARTSLLHREIVEKVDSLGDIRRCPVPPPGGALMVPSKCATVIFMVFLPCRPQFTS